MATEAQIRANRENAKKSTGPRTAEGRAKSSRNAVYMGMYTQTDYVLPEESEVYHLFCINLDGACNAVDAIEECLAAEIVSSAWRLRRCNLVDGDIAANSGHDPLLDTTLEKQIRSVERARAHSTSVFHRSLNQLRKLQKDRLAREAKPEPKPEPEPQIAEEQFLSHLNQQLNSIVNCPEPDWDEIDRRVAENKAKESELGSFCKPTPATPQPAPNYPRNRPCPCRSGKKFKHCCLGKAA